MKKSKMVERIGVGLMLAVALLAAPAGFAQETKQTDSPPAATDAYAAMTQADESRDNEDWAGAISGYRDALGLYRRLASSRPDWEPEAVRYRISYCANQIEKIGRTTGQSASELVTNSAPSSPADSEGFRERYFALVQENQYLRQRQIEMESDTTGSHAVTNDSGTIEKLKAENEELQNKLATSTPPDSGAQTAELNARIGKLDEERTALAAENEALKQQLEAAITQGPAAAVELPEAAGAQDVREKMHEGLLQERSGNPAGALAIYEQVLSARPLYVEAVKARGRCLLQQGKSDEAIAIFRAVTFADRDDSQALVLLGTAYCLAEKYSAAVEVLTPLVVNDPSNALAQNAIGAAWMGMGDARSAKIALEKAVSLDPELADARFNLAQVLVAGDPNDADRAREHYRKALVLGAQPDAELQKQLGVP
jgi:tetratricopeptide (TPR) repeat protein